ncbi:MAG TPA: BCAM0308 family protein [Anaerolineales bacterium]|nr:BCAM0308 family protein [Anaerolineales bacterium]
MANRVRLDAPKFPSREDKMYSLGREDPYQSRKKMPDPARCPVCGAIFTKGRWTWKGANKGVHEELCPADQRIKDRVPAGVVNIKGAFFEAHADEIINLIKNQEKLEKERHPLERLMAIKRPGRSLRIETTGMHMARRLGDALEAAYQGNLDIEYLKGQYKVRVRWER